MEQGNDHNQFYSAALAAVTSERQRTMRERTNRMRRNRAGHREENKESPDRSHESAN